MSIQALIVEDCMVMVRVIKKTMLMSGLPIDYVDSACNGKEGLKMLRRKPYNLIIADINMPVMSGDQMIRILEKHPDFQDISILIATSDKHMISSKRISGRMYDFIQKPFTPELLRDKIITILEKNSEVY